MIKAMHTVPMPIRLKYTDRRGSRDGHASAQDAIETFPGMIAREDPEALLLLLPPFANTTGGV